MPAAEITAAYILGGANLGAAALSSGSQWMMNEKQAALQEALNAKNWERQFQLLQQQRDWALSDWDKVNAYNDPRQQMQRYRDAGLNPNLIYGNAQNSPAAMIRSATANTTEAKAPQLSNRGYELAASQLAHGGSQILQAYVAQKQLQMEQQRTDADVELKNAQRLKTLSDADYSKWNSQFHLENTNLFLNKLQNETSESLFRAIKTNATTPYGDDYQTRFKAETERILQQSNLTKETIERVKALTTLAIQEGAIKQTDVNFVETLSASPVGAQMLINILKLILKK